MWHKIIFIGFLLLGLGGCAHKKRALNLYRDEVKAGVSSLDILKKYGPATQMWHDGDSNVYSYSYSKPVYDFMSFLPVPLFRSKFDNYEVVLAFDGQGQLMEVNKFNNNMMVKSWLICEFGVGQCEISRD